MSRALLLLLLLVAVAATVSPASAALPAKPNVVMIVVDDLGVSHRPSPKQPMATPAIAEIAERGVCPQSRL